ncbi:hypothetical protein ATN88_19625 [Enterovibrio coralii]|uniref:Uncharacterized protein n=1 Tax=Enterovibrio coralii TaxID=294935 RepID=A0A135I9H2_9GAMM|nr:hypothetical protein ATN88_19625 [Enterovibrio coralii]
MALGGCVTPLSETLWVSLQGTPVPQSFVNELSVRCLKQMDPTEKDPLALERCLLQSGVLQASSFYEITPYLVEATATRLNADTPVMVDDATRLDSVEHQGRTLRLNHTIIDDVVEDINVAHFRRMVPDLVKQNTCFAPPMTVLMENDVVFQYSYIDAEGKPITEFSITLSDCQ